MKSYVQKRSGGGVVDIKLNLKSQKWLLWVGRGLGVFAVTALVGYTVGGMIKIGKGMAGAASTNITVTNNNQVISQDQSSNIKTITKTSTVTVKNSEASYGYTLTAQLAENTLQNSTVHIYSTGSSTCSAPGDCPLNTSTPTTILTTDNDTATTTNGDTTTWTVQISVPANTPLGNYIVDIAYDELANPYPPTLSPAQGATVDNGTTTVTVTSTSSNTTCKWGTAAGSYPNNSGTTRTTTTGTNTLYYQCIRTDGDTTATRTGSWSYTGKVPGPTDPGTTLGSMQALTNANCPTTLSTAFDARNNQIYYVKKVGSLCWMHSNLRYSGGGNYNSAWGWSDDRKTLNLVSGTAASSYTVPQYANPGGATSYTNTTAAGGFYGYLYNWCAAMGGQADACQGSTATQPNTSITICPAGWRLPTGGSGGEFQTLITALGNPTTGAALNTSFLAVYSGVYYSGLGNQGSLGSIWSSTVSSSFSAYYLGYLSSNVNPAIGLNKYYGYAVRCVR